jgi:hypothetical protein
VLTLALPRRAAPTTPPRRGSTYPALTPPRPTPPAVISACARTRPGLDCYGPAASVGGSAASSLLSRVASSRRHSGTSAKEVLPFQMVASPEMKASGDDEVEERYDEMMDAASDGGVLNWDDAIRFWPGTDHQGMLLLHTHVSVELLTLGAGGYISFPDFERFSQSSEDGDQEPEHEAVESPKN